MLAFAGLGRHMHSVLGINQRNRELIDVWNPKMHRKLADDKVLAKELMAKVGIPLAKTYAVIETLHEVSRFPASLKSRPEFVIKPARGRAGIGIVVLTRETSSSWVDPSAKEWGVGEIRQRLANITFGDYSQSLSDRALIEERIFPGLILGDLPVSGLPDIRIITLHETPVMAMVRLPTVQSGGRANLHMGAVGVGIDIETGESTGATWRNRDARLHPDTKQPLLGLRVHQWDTVIETARRVARAFPLRYLGIDIVIPEASGDLEHSTGVPLVLEVNVRPGLQIQNANVRGLRGALDGVQLNGVQVGATR
jgi:alpha-L-glutamate ligase-like protein